MTSNPELRKVALDLEAKAHMKTKEIPAGLWVKQENGTFFEVRRRDHVAVDRFKEFVTKLPPGAKVVPAPPMANHSLEDLKHLAVMREDHVNRLLEKGSTAHTQTMALLDHPTLTFKQKTKKLWALLKQFKRAMVSKDRGRSIVQGDEGREDKITWGTRNPGTPPAPRQQKPTLDMDPAAKERALSAMKEIDAWYKPGAPLVLQANECSRLHALVDLMTTGFALGLSSASDAVREIASQRNAMWEHVQTFVVKHDWRAAFKDELGKVSDEEFVLPFPTTAFEFKVNGRACTMVAIDPMSGVIEKAQELQNKLVGDTEGLTPGRKFYLFIAASNGSWISRTENRDYAALHEFLIDQVKAICVMLDAKIAEYETVHQPAALNAKRQKTGKLPLFDYRVVDLATKYRTHGGSGSTGAGSGVRQRCHLRRGHWVHSDHQPRAELGRTFKRWTEHDGRWRTWVNWYLAGDPDLGFVEKEYKL